MFLQTKQSKQKINQKGIFIRNQIIRNVELISFLLHSIIVGFAVQVSGNIVYKFFDLFAFCSFSGLCSTWIAVPKLVISFLHLSLSGNLWKENSFNWNMLFIVTLVFGKQSMENLQWSVYCNGRHHQTRELLLTDWRVNCAADYPFFLVAWPVLIVAPALWTHSFIAVKLKQIWKAIWIKI